MAVNDGVRRRLRVNPVLCNGYGYCAEIVPEVISLDDWGFPAVKPGTIEDDKVRHLAERAITTCPRLALLLEEIVSDTY